MDQEGSDISVAAFGDAEQARSPATRALPWHETKPGRKLTTIPVRGGIASRRDKRGSGQGSDPLDAFEPSACFAGFAKLLDPAVIGTDSVVSHNKLVLKVQNERPGQWVEYDHIGPKDLWQPPPQGRKIAGNNDAELCKDTADLVGKRRPVADQPRANAMARLNAQLLTRLYRYKPHAGAACGLTNRFRVIQVTLVGLNVRLYELRADQPSFVAEIHKRARPVMRAGAGLHSNQTGRHIGKETANFLSPQGLSDHRIVSIINAVNLKYILR
jgi:hypothetical protein